MAEEMKTLETKQEGDPADFLLSNPKYHDCHVTVGNPDTDDVERIGVSSTHLIAHSPVFRDMLSDSQLADPTGANTHIKDVSPATFKLMLRHVYGGKLPKMTTEEAAELALCADKYNIQRLLGKAVKRLKPKNVDDFLLAFKVVMFIICPDLELEVTKFVQENTDKILQSPKFLELDEDSILFIVKQSTLSISELELWKNILRWAENQVEKTPGKSLKECLHNSLQHIRFSSFTVEEITKYVLPTKILNPEEFVHLSEAVTNNKVIQLPGFCNSKEKRNVYGAEVYTLRASYDPRLVELECQEYSNLTIKTTKKIELISLTLKSFQAANKNYPSFGRQLECKVVGRLVSKGQILEYLSDMEATDYTCPNQIVTLKVTNKYVKEPVILEGNKEYCLTIETSPPLPVFQPSSGKFTPFTRDKHGMSVTFEDPLHIFEISYKVLD